MKAFESSINSKSKVGQLQSFLKVDNKPLKWSANVICHVTSQNSFRDVLYCRNDAHVSIAILFKILNILYTGLTSTHFIMQGKILNWSTLCDQAAPKAPCWELDWVFRVRDPTLWLCLVWYSNFYMYKRVRNFAVIYTLPANYLKSPPPAGYGSGHPRLSIQICWWRMAWSTGNFAVTYWAKIWFPELGYHFAHFKFMPHIAWNPCKFLDCRSWWLPEDAIPYINLKNRISWRSTPMELQAQPSL